MAKENPNAWLLDWTVVIKFWRFFCYFYALKQLFSISIPVILSFAIWIKIIIWFRNKGKIIIFPCFIDVTESTTICSFCTSSSFCSSQDLHYYIGPRTGNNSNDCIYWWLFLSSKHFIYSSFILSNVIVRWRYLLASFYREGDWTVCVWWFSSWELISWILPDSESLSFNSCACLVAYVALWRLGCMWSL